MCSNERDWTRLQWSAPDVSRREERRGEEQSLWGVLVLPKLQVNAQKLGVQAPHNLEFEQAIAMLKCVNLQRTNSTKYETQNILVKFQQNEHTPGIPDVSEALVKN